MQERKIAVVFEKDPNKDHEKEGIKYFGYKVLWEDGSTVGVGLEQLCSAGIRTVVGKKNIAERQKVQLTTHWLESADAPKLVLSDGARCRRLYIQREGENARLFFHNGNPTDIIFTPRDDERALSLFRCEDAINSPLWFDLVTKTLES